MRVSMPRGAAHGWGIAGEYLSKEIAALPPLDGVTLHCMRGYTLEPFCPDDWDKINIGYCFFEDSITVLEYTRNVAAQWDMVVAGSRWCEYYLRIGGVEKADTILQGVDGSLFYPGPKRAFTDRFVVFSGGKFELRKSQDLVICAMKEFMARHDDVVLSAAWYNQWPFSLATMELSTLIKYRHRDGDCLEIIAETLTDNGIPLDRVILHPLLHNQEMHRIYLDSDVGIFPNRGEGGNNMVMCEYMACGRPVIASDMTGHADVITTDNALPLTQYKPYHYRHYAEGVWFEPSVQEIVDKLEYAYNNKRELRAKGLKAAEDMARLNWKEAALRFHAIGERLLAARNRSHVPSSSPTSSGRQTPGHGQMTRCQ